MMHPNSPRQHLPTNPCVISFAGQLTKTRLILIGLLAAGQLSLAEDAQPLDATAVLAELKAIQENQKISEKQFTAKVLQDFSSAAFSNSSAIAFYQEAVRSLSFKGGMHEQTLFAEWKKKEADNLKSEEMQTAAKLHLTYLVLTLKRANGATIPELMPALTNYANQLAAARETVGPQELLRRSVNDSPFVQWYGIGKMLSGAKNWENNVGNLDGIYQRTILPQMRRDKDPRILDYWDTRIQREAAEATKSGGGVNPVRKDNRDNRDNRGPDSRDARIQREANEAISNKSVFKAEQFETVTKPRLLWNRAQDLGAIGLRNRAIREMYTLIKTYPDYPDKAAWISELTNHLSNPTSFQANVPLE